MKIQWFPSHCCCRSLALYHIRSANYGQEVKLDGINIIYTIFFQKLFVNKVLCSYLLQKMQISNKDEFYWHLIVQAKRNSHFVLLFPPLIFLNHNSLI
jgi:hypothetical protein